MVLVRLAFAAQMPTPRDALKKLGFDDNHAPAPTNLRQQRAQCLAMVP
jgi:hypothetical protein